jgi:hypothetical protein
MPKAVDHDQQIALSHRVNFFGRPAGPGRASWEYAPGGQYQVSRPDDGQPAGQWQPRCDFCDKELRFTMHSVQATRGRQARWRACAWAGLGLLIVGVAVAVAIGGGAVPFFAAVAVAGAMAGYYAGKFAAAEIGVTGHLAGKPGMAKHAVALVASRPAGPP